jgi:hypothetical protein
VLIFANEAAAERARKKLGQRITIDEQQFFVTAPANPLTTRLLLRPAALSDRRQDHSLQSQFYARNLYARRLLLLCTKNTFCTRLANAFVRTTIERKNEIIVDIVLIDD